MCWLRLILAVALFALDSGSSSVEALASMPSDVEALSPEVMHTT
jgi:hypothetical protein